MQLDWLAGKASKAGGDPEGTRRARDSGAESAPVPSTAGTLGTEDSRLSVLAGTDPQANTALDLRLWNSFQN